MITPEQILKLSSSANILLTYVETQLEALRNSMDNWDFWFLKSIQDMVPFLSFLSDDRLAGIGPIILDRLQIIKIYPGIISILQKIYEDATITVDSPRPGTLSLSISGTDLQLLENLILSTGEKVILSTGEEVVLKGEFTEESVSFDDFINNFLLAGVHLTDFIVNGEVGITSYSKNNIRKGAA